MAPTGKTQRKSLPKHLTPGNPGNSGGKKGRSGRKPEQFLELCAQASTDPALWAESRRKNPNHVLEMSGSYVVAKPKQGVELTGTVTIKHVYDE